MYCPTCGKQNVDGALFCYACGKTMSAAGAATPPPGVTPAMMPQIPITPLPGAASVRTEHRMGALGWICLLLSLVIGFGAVMMTPVPASNANNAVPYRMGEMFALFFIPFAIALAVFLLVGRKTGRRPALFAGIFFGLTLAMSGLIVLGTYAQQHPTESSDARIARLIKEATGEQPEKSLPGADGELDTVLRDFLRGVQQRNRDYQAEIRNLDQSEMRRLYSSYSFSSPAEIQRVNEQLQAALDVDQRQEQALRALVDTTEAKIRALDMSDKDKEDAVAGMERSLVPIYAARGDLMGSEKDWIGSTESLYQYGYEQYAQIQIRGNDIVIADPSIRDEFNNRWRASRQAEQTFNNRKKEFDLKMRSMQGTSGVSPSDVQKLAR